MPSRGSDSPDRKLAGADLRTVSFHDRDLHGADLHGADLRGADFSGADLHDADLRGVRTGLPLRASIILALAGVVVSVALGALSAWAGDRAHYLLQQPDLRHRIAGWVIVAEIPIFLLVAILKGFGPALTRVAAPIALIGAVIGVIAVFGGVGTGEAAATVIALALLNAGIIVGGTFARAAAGGAGSVFLVIAALSGMLMSRSVGGGIGAMLVAVSSVIVARRVLRGDVRYPRLIHTVARAVCLGGTNFRGADLHGAHFDGATLRGADFRGAALDHTTFAGAKDAHLARFDARPTQDAPPPG
jgi:uncharacterized protein YjbI with pentapeptide repeats